MYCALNSSINLCFSLVWFQVWTWYPRSNQLLTTSFAEFPPNLITLPNAAANSMVRCGRYAEYSTYRANTPKRIGRNCLSIWLKRNACSFGSICLIFQSQIHQLFISLVWVWLTGMLVRVYTRYLHRRTNEIVFASRGLNIVIESYILSGAIEWQRAQKSLLKPWWNKKLLISRVPGPTRLLDRCGESERILWYLGGYSKKKPCITSYNVLSLCPLPENWNDTSVRPVRAKTKPTWPNNTGNRVFLMAKLHKFIHYEIISGNGTHFRSIPV